MDLAHFEAQEAAAAAGAAAAAAAAADALAPHMKSLTPAQIMQSLTPTRLRPDDIHDTIHDNQSVLVRAEPEMPKHEGPSARLTEAQALAASQNGPNGRRRSEQ